MAGSDRAEGWSSGDRIRLRGDFGGFFRPRLRRGAQGIVVGVLDDGRLAVRFRGDETTEIIDPRLVESL